MEIGVILILLVLLFGADKIPKLARSAGDAKKEFEKAKMEADKELQEAKKEMEEEAATETSEKNGDGTTTASTDG